MAIPAAVSSSFCVPHETQIVVRRKSMFNLGQYTITDERGSLLFSTKKEGWIGRFTWSLSDASGKVLLSMKEKVRQWIVSDGDSKSHLLFTFAWKSSLSQLCGGESYVVFLPASSLNPSRPPDFTVERKAWSSEWTILFDDRPVAEARSTFTNRVVRVKVYPGVDRAFISALIFLCNED